MANKWHILKTKHCTCFGYCLNHLHRVSVPKGAYSDVVQLVAADHWNICVQCYIKLFQNYYTARELLKSSASEHLVLVKSL